MFTKVDNFIMVLVIDGKITNPEVISNSDAWLFIHKIYDGTIFILAGY